MAETFVEEVLGDIKTKCAYTQTLEVARKHGATIGQCGIHKPKGSMPFGKQAYHSCTDSNFNLLNRRKKKKSQLLIEMIETNDLGKTGTWFEYVLCFVCFHQSPITCQTKITDGVKNVLGFGIVIYLKPSFFQNVNLLLECQQLLSVFHNPINKKWPALVRYIPCGREAAAGSIGCKGTAFIRNSQTFQRKNA